MGRLQENGLLAEDPVPFEPLPSASPTRGLESSARTSGPIPDPRAMMPIPRGRLLR